MPRSTPGEVVPVVGNELGNGLERTMPSSSASPKARAKAKAKPEPRPAPAEERLPRPQEIAEEALGFTAFVR
ncbi:MAG TPA: hypothetical protein VKY73_04755, partial [Polyangiaceae bacterium]|nr:hypothetical protein [Polyangiaceae bacterium]